MLYVFPIEVPANTTSSDPVVQVLELDHGVVRRVEVSFAPGAAALCHVVVRDGLHQVWPSNQDESFAWDDYTVSFLEDYALDRPPFRLVAEAWNEDDTYPHTVVVRLLVLAAERRGVSDMVRRLFEG